MSQKNQWNHTLGVTLSVVLLFGSLYCISGKNSFFSYEESTKIEPPRVSTYAYGFLLDTFQLAYRYAVNKDESLSDILSYHKVSVTDANELVANTKHLFDPKQIQKGKLYSILAKDSACAADFLVYELDAKRYMLYDLKNRSGKMNYRATQTKMMLVSGIVQSSLWNTLTTAGLSFDLAAKMEEAFKWSVDFQHVAKGDKFKLLFEQIEIDEKPVGVGRLLGAYFEQNDKKYQAIYYEDEDHKGYFDAEGRPMRKGFLKSPLAFSTITSNFNMARLHPILGDVRPHLGTDYAAPRGTPIIAVADGTVEQAQNSGGNGNFVKLRHDKMYETQYLHMNGFAKGIRPGVRVQQGEVIGFVGATGLATGPHVCFRFWKNGAQVNHLKETLPRPQPMGNKDLEKFIPIRDDILAQLAQIDFVNQSTQP